jgi:NAD(P)-dependent dehydrogenase (short-subunit alcohol dehydrogenase family)
VKHEGVTVNCVLPSVIDTPGNRAAMGDADHSRWVKPEEIGHVIRFLTSPEASAVTGAALPVYGRA